MLPLNSLEANKKSKIEELQQVITTKKISLKIKFKEEMQENFALTLLTMWKKMKMTVFSLQNLGGQSLSAKKFIFDHLLIYKINFLKILLCRFIF